MPANGSNRPVVEQVLATQGGPYTIDDLKAGQEKIYDNARSPLSAAYTMTGSEVTIYEYVPTVSSVINGGSIDMTTLATGDTVIVKLYLKNVSGGAYVKWSEDAIWTFTDAQDAKLKLLPNNIFNRYGYKVTITQTAGTNRTFNCEFFDAAPGV